MAVLKVAERVIPTTHGYYKEAIKLRQCVYEMRQILNAMPYCDSKILLSHAINDTQYVQFVLEGEYGGEFR